MCWTKEIVVFKDQPGSANRQCPRWRNLDESSYRSNISTNNSGEVATYGAVVVVEVYAGLPQLAAVAEAEGREGDMVA